MQGDNHGSDQDPAPNHPHFRPPFIFRQHETRTNIISDTERGIDTSTQPPETTEEQSWSTNAASMQDIPSHLISPDKAERQNLASILASHVSWDPQRYDYRGLGVIDPLSSTKYRSSAEYYPLPGEYHDQGAEDEEATLNYHLLYQLHQGASGVAAATGTGDGSEAASDPREALIRKQREKEAQSFVQFANDTSWEYNRNLQEAEDDSEDYVLGDYSLYIFHPKNKFRVACRYICKSILFYWSMHIVTILNCVYLAFLTPLSADSVWTGWKYVFIPIYAMEMTVKVISAGAIKNCPTNKARKFYGPPYLTNPWNVMDCLIFIVGTATVSRSSAVFAARAFNILLILKRFGLLPKLTLIVEILFKYTISLLSASAQIAFVIFLIATVALVLFFGSMHTYCNNGEAMLLDNISNSPILCGQFQCPLGSGIVCSESLVRGPDTGIMFHSPWYGYYNYDNIFSSALATFVTVSSNGWALLSTYLMQVETSWVAFYFAVAVFVGCYLFMNLVQIILIDAFQNCYYPKERRLIVKRSSSKRASRRRISYRDTREKSDDTVSKESNLVDQQTGSDDDNDDEFIINPENRYAQWPLIQNVYILYRSLGAKFQWLDFIRVPLKRFVLSEMFSFILFLVTATNCVVLALQGADFSSEKHTIYDELNNIFCIIFICEALLKIFALGIWDYLLSWSNLLELFIAIASAVELASPQSFGSATVFRAFRIFMFLKYVPLWDARKTERAGMNAAFVIPVILLMIFIFAVLGMNGFGASSKDIYGNICTSKSSEIWGCDRLSWTMFWMSYIIVFIIFTRYEWTNWMWSTMQNAGAWWALFYVLVYWILALIFWGTFVALIVISYFSYGKFSKRIEYPASISLLISKTERWFKRAASYFDATERSDVENYHFFRNSDDGNDLPKSSTTDSGDVAGNEAEQATDERPESESSQTDETVSPMAKDVSIWSKTQSKLKRITSSRLFLLFTLLNILSSTILVAFYDHGISESKWNSLRLGQTAVFASWCVEYVCRIAAKGFIKYPDSYLRNRWYILDLVTMAGYLADIVQLWVASKPGVVAINSFRCLRPVRFLVHLSVLRHILNALRPAFRRCVYMSVGFFIFIFMFAILGVGLFGNQFSSCRCSSLYQVSQAILELEDLEYDRVAKGNASFMSVLPEAPWAFEARSFDWIQDASIGIGDGSDTAIGSVDKLKHSWQSPLLRQSNDSTQVIQCNASLLIGKTNAPEACRQMNGLWIPYVANFDTTTNAMLTMFVVSTLDAWTFVMFNAMDCAGIDKQPVQNNKPWNSLFFLVYVFVAMFFTANYTAIVLDAFTEESPVNAGYRLLTVTQREWRTRQQYFFGLKLDHVMLPSFALMSRFPVVHRRVFRLVTAYGFEIFMKCVVIAALVLVLIAVYPISAAQLAIMVVFQGIVACLFVLESILKIFAFGIRQYVSSFWNVFDCLLSALSMTRFIYSAIMFRYDRSYFQHSALMILALLSLFWLARLFRSSWRSMPTILKTVWFSLPGFVNICLLILVISVAYALLGVSLFSEIPAPINPPIPGGGGLWDYGNYQNFVGSWLLTLQIITVDSWSRLMYDIASRGGAYSYAWLYFVPFVAGSLFFLLNLFLVVLFDAFMFTNARMYSRVTGYDFTRFGRIWSQFDPFSEKMLIVGKDLDHFLRKIGPPLGVRENASMLEIFAFIRDLDPKLLMDSNGRVEFQSVLECLIAHTQKVDLASASFVDRLPVNSAVYPAAERGRIGGMDKLKIRSDRGIMFLTKNLEQASSKMKSGLGRDNVFSREDPTRDPKTAVTDRSVARGMIVRASRGLLFAKHQDIFRLRKRKVRTEPPPRPPHDSADDSDADSFVSF